VKEEEDWVRFCRVTCNGISLTPSSSQARTAAIRVLPASQGLVEEAGEADLEGFAQASTPAEWRQKGTVFRRRGMFDIAAECFDRGEAPKEARVCRGRARVKAAMNSRKEGRDFTTDLGEAATLFLATGRKSYADRAATCLVLSGRPDWQSFSARILHALSRLDPARYTLRAASALSSTKRPT